jgi:membrane protein
MAADSNMAQVSKGVGSASRTLRRAGRAVVRGAVDFYNSNNLTFASSIAYYSLLSFFPFVLISLELLGRVAAVKGDQPFLRLVALVIPSHFDFVAAQTNDLSNAPLKLSVISTILLIWASMGVFSAVTTAVNYAWGVERPPSYLKNKLLSFMMLITAALLLLMTLILMSVIQARHTDWFTRLIYLYPFIGNVEGFLVRAAPTVMLIVVIAMIYYFVPNTKVRLRDVWVGAILAGVLWRLAFMGFALYVKGYSKVSVHGSITAVVLFLVWVYVSAVLLLYGVEVSAAFSRLEAEERAERATVIHAGSAG